MPQAAPAQDRVYNYIVKFYRVWHRPPTYREIAIGLDRSYHHAYTRVKALENNGRIYFDETHRIRIRGLKVVVPRSKKSA